MSEKDVKQMFEKSGALLEGHFILTSGRHSDRYMQCALVLQYPEYTEALARELAAGFKDSRIDVVAGPAMGGIIVAYEVARQLGVRSIFCEREEGRMTLRRGFTINPGERVLVVEDVITTGGSVKEVIEVIRSLGGEVAGVAVLVDRSGGKVDFGVPVRTTLTMDIQSYPPEQCPLCKEGKLVAVKPGSRDLK